MTLRFYLHSDFPGRVVYGGLVGDASVGGTGGMAGVDVSAIVVVGGGEAVALGTTSTVDLTIAVKGSLGVLVGGTWKNVQAPRSPVRNTPSTILTTYLCGVIG